MYRPTTADPHVDEDVFTPNSTALLVASTKAQDETSSFYFSFFYFCVVGGLRSQSAHLSTG